MAHVRKPSGRSGYLGVYRAPDGREKTKLFDRKKDAQAWAIEQERAVRRGDWLDPTSGKVTVGEYGQEWLQIKLDVKKSTRDNYERLLRVQIAPAWARTPVAAVTHEAVTTWVAGLHRSGLSPSRVRQAHLTLKQVLDLAVRTKRIPSNPAVGVRLPALPGKADAGRRFLTAAQVWAIAEQCPSDSALPLHVMAWCGLRSGEVAGLQVRDFDQLGRELAIRRAIVDEGGHLRVETPKTKTSVRTVPVPQWLVPLLAEQLVGKGAD
ncbi:site-specific integrase, partial [Kineococcus glutinatus]|uniref:site-specific integrase n=1 Tax=Kineococcus glutinatus TaxID=1070872 RepID=UPI003CD074C7